MWPAVASSVHSEKRSSHSSSVSGFQKPRLFEYLVKEPRSTSSTKKQRSSAAAPPPLLPPSHLTLPLTQSTGDST